MTDRRTGSACRPVATAAVLPLYMRLIVPMAAAIVAAGFVAVAFAQNAGSCPATHPFCGSTVVGGAREQCEKAGKLFGWSPGNETCKLPNGDAGKCYSCTDFGTCPANYSCGVAGGQNAASCPDGKTVEWSNSSILCALGQPAVDGGRCYRCVDPGAEDPPPMCPVGCAVDKDCGGAMRCKMGQNPDGSPTGEPLCWKDADSNLCVKKCLVPRCIQNKCELAPPAEGAPGYPYVPCEGMTSCPAARCGDGVVQGHGADGQPSDRNPGTGGNSCDLAQSTCVNVPGATACQNGVCMRTVNDPIVGSSCTCNQGSGGGSITCNVTGTSCAQITDARACKEPYCVDVNGRRIQGTSCSCTPAPGQLDCRNGYRGLGPNTPISPVPNNCAGGWYVQAANSTCNCVMAAVPGAKTSSTNVASVLKAQAAPVDGGEECDDGNAVAGDGCGATCKKEVCGDGILQAKGADGKENTADDEACDDGNIDRGDGCDEVCKKETCGNGIHDYGEECDNGDKNSDTAPGACRKNCMLAKCNDGVVDVWPDDFGLDEQCDCGPAFANFDWVEANKPGSTLKPYCNVTVDGHPALCHVGNCQAFYCGDGFTFNTGLDLESGTKDDEMCDAGPFNTDGLPAGAECENAAQCGGLPCVSGKCVETSCTADSGCAAGAKCIKGECRPGGCQTDDDCKAGQTCGSDGNCSMCTVDADCASGYCYPNGSCSPVKDCKGAECTAGSNGCRNDCKPARCGDGIVDKAAGETCDEGEKMMKCQGFPQPSCNCAVPTWGSLKGDGKEFAYTCCADGSRCTIWGTETCPANCGVKANPVNDCNNGRLDEGEECDITDQAKLFLFRPNRDGRKLSFIEDNGRWKAVPASIEKKYTAIDHAPVELTSPDRAWIASQSSGIAITYFHLWDVVASQGETSLLTGRVGVDFTGNAKDWMVLETPLRPVNNLPIPISDLNSAIVTITGDEAKHELTLALFHTSGRRLTQDGIIKSPVQVTSAKPISIDALEIEVRASETTDPTACVECLIQRCGNNVLEERLGEACDDGNAESGDGCTDKCELEICAAP